MRYRRQGTKRLKQPKDIQRIVEYDDREKNPWLFLEGYGYTLIRKRLQTGDYHILTSEGEPIVIEKKSGFDEIIMDIAGKNRRRFKECLTRLAAVNIKFLVIEDTLAGIRRATRKLPGRAKIDEYSLYYWYIKILAEYGIPVVLTGRKKHVVVKELFDQCVLFAESRYA